MSSAKWRPFCLSHNVLIDRSLVEGFPITSYCWLVIGLCQAGDKLSPATTITDFLTKIWISVRVRSNEFVIVRSYYQILTQVPAYV